MASGLDYKLPHCNEVLIGKDLLFFGVTHNKQHPKGSKLIAGGFFTLFWAPTPNSCSLKAELSPEQTDSRFL